MSPQRLGCGRREADWSSVIVSQQGKLMILCFALRCRCCVFFHIMPSKPQEKVSGHRGRQNVSERYKDEADGCKMRVSC